MPTDYVLELPNDLRAIEAAVNYLIDRAQEIGFNKERLRLNLRVGMTEALANAMLYGNGRDPRKRVRIDAKVAKGSLTIRVTDEGRGFNPATISDPTVGRNRMRAGGRGIFLIRKLMDEVEFNDRGNSITMVLFSESSQNARESAS